MSTSILPSPALLSLDTALDPVNVPLESHIDSPASVSSSQHGPSSAAQKRKSSVEEVASEHKPKKPRAARACVICRARKVQCDYMRRLEQNGHPGPCTRCADDGQVCEMAESKRQKNRKPTNAPADLQPSHISDGQTNNGDSANVAQSVMNGVVDPAILESITAQRAPIGAIDESQSTSHIPHYLYAHMNDQMRQSEPLRDRASTNPAAIDHDAISKLVKSASLHGDMERTRLAAFPDSNTASSIVPRTLHNRRLPNYVTPLHPRMENLELEYLSAKGALKIPDVAIRNALLQSYLVWVHPFMPLIDVNDFLHIVNDGTGASGKVSLLLLQAVMFTGTAFVDMKYLSAMGFSKRKAARKAFFEKCRVLYDLNYELDRVASVQALLLMTYWYETPDDQKDTWHWMGVAISVAQTIGLHRNPKNSHMPEKQKKLWKRMWWSCFMRDRLIALGMRRPTRIKDEDFDVPMLTLADFEIKAIPLENRVVSSNCPVARDEKAQEQLAEMCVAKAKLSLCISQVLSAQYSVLVRHGGPSGAKADVMLIPKKGNQAEIVESCDSELTDWKSSLPVSCLYSRMDLSSRSGPSIFLHRALLHMVYYTTLSALHRPQVLPAAGTPTSKDTSKRLRHTSKEKVCEASREITKISEQLIANKVEMYLPTSGVTVLLPAIIIHLLDIKSNNDVKRQAAVSGYRICMGVLEKLRDNYASADFATQFLAAAIKKADIGDTVPPPREVSSDAHEEPIVAGRPTSSHSAIGDEAFTPPGSVHSSVHSSVQSYEGFPDAPTLGAHFMQQEQVQEPTAAALQAYSDMNSATQSGPPDMIALGIDESLSQSLGNEIDMSEFFAFDDALDNGAHGESGGWVGDMNWIDDGNFAEQWPGSNSTTLADGSILLG